MFSAFHTALIEPANLLWPSAAHLALTAFLYVWLSVERGLSVLGQRNRYSDFARPGGDMGRGARVASNLRNQFEAPPFFHMLVLALVLSGDPVQGQLWLAWVFVIGRVLHTGVQTLTDNVVLRGIVFSINFLALVGMWVSFFFGMLSSG
ncbi:MAPEG family protein [Oceanicaulis sp.]|uniref:MAPEG family protein n=1 Tax=Oceanicaulis sp. TaxID=1924941 RepID=UPI003F730510